MGMNHKIVLPEKLIQRCNKFGERVVDSYRAGLNQASLSVSYRGADKNVALQAEAKMAECAFCLWAGLDPIETLHWGRAADLGYDVIYKGSRLDIKWVGLGRKYLIWSKAKNDFFDTRPFDAFVLVKGLRPRFEVSGWLSKYDFYHRHGIAGRSHVLDEGTWFMDSRELWGMDDFYPPGMKGAQPSNVVDLRGT